MVSKCPGSTGQGARVSVAAARPGTGGLYGDKAGLCTEHLPGVIQSHHDDLITLSPSSPHWQATM